MELPSEFPSLPPIADPVSGGTGPGLDIGRPVTTSTPTVSPVDPAHGLTSEFLSEQIFGSPGQIPDTPGQQAGLAAAAQYLRDNPYASARSPHTLQAFLDGVRAYERQNAAPVTPTVTAAINPTGTGGVQVSGILPTEEIVPNVGGYFSQVGQALGGVINDIFQTDQSWDAWGQGLGTIADVLVVTGVIPGSREGHGYTPYQERWAEDVLTRTPGTFPGPITTQAPTLTQPWPGGENPWTTNEPPRGLPMPHIPTSIPVAFPGGAPVVQQAAFPMQITPGGGGGQIRPAAHCSTSLPSRVDIPTVDARGNTRYTTFKNMGRPLLWSGDLAASKRVRKVAAKARRAKGR